MNSNKHTGTKVRLLALFVLLSAIPLVALGWLGRRMLEQDREIETKRQKKQLDNAAGAVARESDRSLTSWEDLLRTAPQTVDSADA